MVICWPCAFAGQLAAPPLAAGAAPPLPLVDALADAPPDALGAGGLAPVLADGVVVPPLLPHAANTMLSIVTALTEPHRCLNRTFIMCFLL